MTLRLTLLGRCLHQLAPQPIGLRAPGAVFDMLSDRKPNDLTHDELRAEAEAVGQALAGEAAAPRPGNPAGTVTGMGA